MSKYKPLADFLGGHVPDEWRVSFEELERTLGFSLPKAAREKAGWWSNDDAAKPHAKAWLGAGWRAEVTDPGTGEVIFRRGEPRPAKAPDPAASDYTPLQSAASDPIAPEVMAAAGAAFEKSKAVDTAKKVGLAAAVVGVLAAGVGLAVKTVMGRRK
jgi:hypothetical protein